MRDTSPMLGVTVIGSANVDLVVRCARIPRPGETVVGRDAKRYLGGKGANQAVAASRVTDDTTFFAVTGADETGEYLQAELKRSGLKDARIHVDPTASTGMALIAVDDASENSIVIVPGANHSWPDAVADRLEKPTICVSQFEIPQRITQLFFERNRRLGGTNILNPAPFAVISPEILGLVDRLVLNETEYLQFRAMDGQADSSLAMLQNDLKWATFQAPIIVTVGDQGVIFKLEAAAGRFQGHRANAIDSTGAGDCFVGVYAALLSQDYPEVEAIRLANAAAAISVTRAGAATSMPYLSEILDFARSQDVVVQPL